MKLEIRLFAGLACRAKSLPCFGKQDFMLKVPDGSTIANLRKLLELPAGTIVTVVNGVVIKESDHQLRDGDRIGMFPPVAGGEMWT